MNWLLLSIAGLVSLAACGDDGASRADATPPSDNGGFEVDPPDAGDVVDPGLDVSEPSDTGLEVETDASSEPIDTGDPNDTLSPSDTSDPIDTVEPRDTAEPVEDTVAEEPDTSGSDTNGPETVVEGPRGQCGDSGDCPGTLLCAESAPGGICNGCSVSDPCPEGHWCNQFGACSRDCEIRADCPFGLRCHPSAEVCVLESCGASADCVAPYVCEGGFCRRPTCGADGACPSPLVCLGDRCVEPGWVD